MEHLGSRTIHGGKLESRADEVIAQILAGGTERAVAAFFGCSPRGVQLFKIRHASELLATKTAVVEQVKHLWITDKVRRLEVLQEVTEMTLIELREFGITIVEERHEQTDGDGAVVITKTRDYRASMAKELRGLLKDAAIEEGQIVPAAPSKGGLTREVIIREYQGIPQEYIG